MDGAVTKAPLGGACTGPNPTDRAKKGTKRSLITEGNGIPIGVAVGPANRHDKMLVRQTLDAIVAERPSPEKVRQNMCADKGYDFPDTRELVEQYGYTAHIPHRGDKRKRRKMPEYRKRARRWVVERTHSWMNRFRRLLVRWEKRTDNYVAMLHLACAWITFSHAGLF